MGKFIYDKHMVRLYEGGIYLDGDDESRVLCTVIYLGDTKEGFDKEFEEFVEWTSENIPSAKYFDQTNTTSLGFFGCYVAPDDLHLMILRYS